MGNILTLYKYKLWSFFGPSLRGKYGPLLYLVLILLFVPSALGIGKTIGDTLKDSDATFAISLIGTMAGGVLAFAFLTSLGPGIAAHPSELDFLMTSPIRPRQYLIADLCFQISTVAIAGGVPMLIAVLTLVWAMGMSMSVALPLLGMLLSYALMVFAIIEIVTITKILHPKGRVGTITVALLLLSLFPAISLALPGSGIDFSTLPIPQAAYAQVGYSVLTGEPVDLAKVGVMVAYIVLVLGTWFALSKAYIFHGIRPTLSGGFGQVDMSVKMAQQRRMIGGLGKYTTKIRMRTETGGDLTLMSRLHLIRIWRDGSMVFVVLLILIGIFPSLGSTGANSASGFTSGAAQILTLPIAILAMMWSYYERENLWLVMVAGRPVRTYFMGFMVSLFLVGICMGTVILAALSIVVGEVPSMDVIGLVAVSPIGASVAAAATVTRVKIPTGGFSAASLAIIFITVLCGVIAGYGTVAAVLVADLADPLGALVIAAVGVPLFVGGAALVSKLADGFKL